MPGNQLEGLPPQEGTVHRSGGRALKMWRIADAKNKMCLMDRERLERKKRREWNLVGRQGSDSRSYGTFQVLVVQF